MVENSGVEKSGVEKSGVEMSFNPYKTLYNFIFDVTDLEF